MDQKNKLLGAGGLAGILATLIILSVIGLIVVYSGAYNVAASEDHTSFGRWAASTTMKNSIEARASGEPAPAFDRNMIAAGAGEYKAMCQQCHGGPGAERASWAKAMLPQPPHLTEAAAHWDANEIHWIVENGIKSSGMPAFGTNHSTDEIWNITAFVKQLPGMTETEYASYPAASHEGAQSGGGHEH